MLDALAQSLAGTYISHMSKAADRLALAALLAKGAPSVTVVSEGVGMGRTDRQWYKAVRDQPVSRPVYEDDSEGAHERYREAINDAYMSGGSRARDEVMAMGVHSFRRK
jgi:hypothetical protein